VLGDQAVQHSDGGVSVDPAIDLDGHGLAGVLVHDIEQLQDPPVLGLVELVVQRPHMIGMLGSQPIRWRRGGAQPLALAPPGGHPQTLLAPQPLNGLAVYPPAGLTQLGVGGPIPPARMGPADLAQLGA
jgi:hypothetical protein